MKKNAIILKPQKYLEKPKIPENWDYDISVTQVGGLIYKWKNLTDEIADELWIAREMLSKIGNPNWNKSSNSQTWTQYCEDIGNSRQVVNRWLREWFESKQNLALLHTGEQENYTPEEIIKFVKDVMKEIDLDPASCDFAQKIVGAKNYFTEKDDGLNKPWFGNVFLNPPYQMPAIRNFTDKLISELLNIKSAILLTNNNTDTLWFHKCAKNCKLLCFTKGRINFYKVDREKTQPTNGQSFFYFGNNEDRFFDVFKEIGLIIRVLDD